MSYIVLSKKRCLPCRNLHDLLQVMELDWPVIWHHDDPSFFDKLGIMSVPTLIKEVGDNEYKIMAIGMPEIKNHIDNINTNEEEE